MLHLIFYLLKQNMFIYNISDKEYYTLSESLKNLKGKEKVDCILSSLKFKK